MSEIATKKSKPTPRKGAAGHLFLLDLSGGRVLSMNPDG
jgi:hypothetical protein